MSLGRRMLIIALSTNVAMMCFVSAVLEIVLPNDIPQWIIFGNIVVFVAMVYNDARRYLVPVGRYRVPTGADIGYRG